MRLMKSCGVLAVAIASTMGVGQVQAEPILQNVGWQYVLDEFSDTAWSNKVWEYASCNSTSHVTNVAGLFAYPTFGQASRPGMCARHQDPDQTSHMRFITLPFDRRDADDENGTDNYCVLKNGKYVVATVDERKGGSEMRSNESDEYIYDGGTNVTGWDTFGQNYLAATNTVKFTWRFRLSDMSMLRAVTNGEKLAAAAVIGQFHAQDKSGVCGAYESGYSPAPGLDVRVWTEPTTGSEYVDFTLFTKLHNDQLPPGATRCATEPCQYDMWTARFPLAQVSRANQSDPLPPWITVQYIMRPSKVDGALKFAFGVSGSTDANLKLQFRPLEGGDGVTKVLKIPMTQNTCPNRPFLGAYVLGYPSKYYGNPAIGETCGTDTNSIVRANHLPDPSVWVRRTVADDDSPLSKYIHGVASNDYPPRLIVDYDDFKIVQMDQLP